MKHTEPGADGEARAGRADRLTPRVLTVCQAVGDFIEGWGFRSIHGRVWTYLAVQRRPVSQVEIAEVLGVSRSLVSLAVSELTEYGLIRAIGSHRNAPYEASLDVWPTITDVLRSREWMLMEKARIALEALIQEAEFEAEAGVESVFDLPRMRLLLAMTDLAQAALRALLSLRVPDSLDAFGAWLERAAKVVRKIPKFLSDRTT